MNKFKKLKEKLLDVIDDCFAIFEKGGRDTRDIYLLILDYYEKEYFGVPLKTFGLTGVEFSIFKLELVKEKLIKTLGKDRFWKIFNSIISIENSWLGAYFPFYTITIDRYVGVYSEDINSNLIFEKYLDNTDRETRISSVKKSIDKFNITKNKFYVRVTGSVVYKDFNFDTDTYTDYDDRVVRFLKFKHDYGDKLDRFYRFRKII